MIRNLLSTTASRLIIALINLSTVWLIARFLGADILGTIALIILGISIIQLVTAVMAGSSLVYQSSRNPLSSLIIAAWLWIFLSCIPVWFILLLMKLIPDGYNTEVLLLSILGSIITVNQNIFLGKEKINLFNGLTILQSIIVFVVLAVMILYFKWVNISAWIIAQYVSMTICTVMGVLISFSSIEEVKFPTVQLVKEAIRFGGFLQVGNIVQLFNYRLSYYFIEKFFDRAALGVFSIGVQLAESIWIIGRSMAILLYSRISNSRDLQYSVKLTVNFMKISAISTTLLILVMLVLPDRFYMILFSNEFDNITGIIASLSVGILAVALSLMLSHYFSGTGEPQHNTTAAIIGLFFTVILGLTLIPLYGLTGAGITASVSYLLGFVYQLIIFKGRSKISWKELIIQPKDIQLFITEMKNNALIKK